MVGAGLRARRRLRAGAQRRSSSACCRRTSSRPRPTPILALAPLLALWFGPGLLGKVVICALIVFFPVAVATMVGIRVGRRRGCSSSAAACARRGGQILTTLEIPAALPSILGGLRVGVTLAVVGAIVGEWAGAERGLGVLINLARGLAVRHPADVRDAPHDRPGRDRALPRRRPRRAPPGRRPLSLPARSSRRSPCHRVPSPSSRCSRSWPRSSSPAAPAAATRRRRRPPSARPSRRRPRHRPLAGPSAAPVKLTVGLGYIPSVQFAPFYLADQAGYYDDGRPRRRVPEQDRPRPRDARRPGRDRRRDLADGTSVIPAVSQGIPIQYIATIYGKFPSIVFAKASIGDHDRRRPQGQEARHPRPLRLVLGHAPGAARVGRPHARRPEIVEYPDFGQGAAVAAGAVDAATGFVNNEPVQLELDREAVTVLRVDDITPLPGPGLIAGDRDARDQARRDRRVRGRDAARDGGDRGDDPRPGWTPRSRRSRSSPRPGRRRRPSSTRPSTSWAGAVQQADGLGAIDTAGWTTSIDYMTELGLVPNPVTVDDVLDPGLLTRRRLTGVLAGVRPSGDAPVVVAARGAGRRGRRDAGSWPTPRRRCAARPRPTSSIVGGGYTGLWTALRLAELAPERADRRSSRRTSAAAGRRVATAAS